MAAQEASTCHRMSVFTTDVIWGHPLHCVTIGGLNCRQA